MSHRITIRLSRDEAGWLEQMVETSEVGVESASEMVRLWLHREWRKRRRLGKPSNCHYSTAARNGRPK
jgi:hypothetical protein